MAEPALGAIHHVDRVHRFLGSPDPMNQAEGVLNGGVGRDAEKLVVMIPPAVSGG